MKTRVTQLLEKLKTCKMSELTEDDRVTITRLAKHWLWFDDPDREDDDQGGPVKGDWDDIDSRTHV